MNRNGINTCDEILSKKSNLNHAFDMIKESIN